MGRRVRGLISATILPSRASEPALERLMSYAIITDGGKQHRLREGERLAAAAVPIPKAEAAAPAPARSAHPPKGYEDMSIAEIKEHVPGWRRPNIEAALEYEKANANRKGAIAALESALAAKEDH